MRASHGSAIYMGELPVQNQVSHTFDYSLTHMFRDMTIFHDEPKNLSK